MNYKKCYNFQDFRTLAKSKLPSPIFNYIDGAADDEAVAVAVGNGAEVATAAGTGAESRAAHPSFPRKLINEALPDGRFAASLTAVDSTIVST